MTLARRLPLVALLPLISSIMTSCNGPKTFTCKINQPTDSGKSFCQIDLDITNQEMKNHGFSYGDIIEATCKKDGYEPKTLVLPYVTNYNEAGTFGPCLCDYESQGRKLNIATGFKTKGIKEAEYYADGTCEIKIKKKDGYKKLRDLASVTTKLTYEECGRENIKYANSRDVGDVGEIYNHIKLGTLYRGSSPISENKNKDRYLVADNYMKYHNIAFDVSLSLTDKEVKDLFDKDKHGEYAKELYNSSNLYTVSLGSDFFRIGEGEGGTKLADTFKKVIEAKPSSIYVHCNEGKDRTGFFAMVIEALCGVSLQDIVSDYMLTFNNYYNITEINNKEKYDAMADLTCYRNIYSFMIDAEDGNDRYNKLAEIEMIDFKAKDSVNKLMDEHKENDYLQNCAKKYLKNIKLTDEQITSLQDLFKK